MSVNKKKCRRLTLEGVQCEMPVGGKANGREADIHGVMQPVCNNHFGKQNRMGFITDHIPVQGQIIKTLDPNPGPITMAYLRKEAYKKGDPVINEIPYINQDPTDYKEDREMTNEEIIAEMEDDFAKLEAQFKAIENDPDRIDEAAELYSDLVEAQRDLNYEINQAAANYSPEKAFVIAGTGTRSIWGDKETMRSIHARLVTLIKGAIEKHGKVIVISGGAKGFDYVLAKAAIDAGAELHLYIPSPSYVDYYWGKAGQERNWINKIVESANFVKTVCDHHQYGKANFRRNEAMIDEADVVWAYPDPANTTGKGGTYSAMNYAKRTNVAMYQVTI